jgi:hypothetical protein
MVVAMPDIGRLIDVTDALLHIHVLPAEPQELTLTHAGDDRKGKQRF